MSRIRILIACRSEIVGDAVAAKLRKHGRFRVDVRVTVNGHCDPMNGLHPRPDLLILHFTSGCGELEHLAKLDAHQRVPLLVFGPANDPQVMRLALRAGASDYLPEPLTESDLLGGIERAVEEMPKTPEEQGSLATVMNSKGGSGASFVACNIASHIASEGGQKATIVDLDLQFGGLAHYLDVTPERGLREALDAIGDLDQVALETYLTNHESGLKLLSASEDRRFHHTSIMPEQVDALLHVLLQNNRHVIVDLPNRIDDISVAVLERSDRVMIVVQQSIAHLNGASRLIQTLHEDIGIQRENIDVVVNRFVKNGIIELTDIRRTLRVNTVHVVPNHYKLVSDSLDSGNPVITAARSSAVSKALRKLATHVGGFDDGNNRKSGFLGRALPALLGAN